MIGPAPFLAAILDAPENDFPRLLYAEWLCGDALEQVRGRDADDRHAQRQALHDRGEFICVQIELAKLLTGKWEVVSDQDGEMHRIRWSVPDEKGRYQWVRHYPQKHFAERQADDFNAGRAAPRLDKPLPEPGAVLRSREAELLERHGREWAVAVMQPILPDYRVHCNAAVAIRGSAAIAWRWQRGFPGRVTLTAEQLMGWVCEQCRGSGWITTSRETGGVRHAEKCPACSVGRVGALGPAIRAVCPVTQWRLSDKRPNRFNDHEDTHYWACYLDGIEREDDFMLPAEIANLLTGHEFRDLGPRSAGYHVSGYYYPTADAAHAALSAAANRWVELQLKEPAHA